jgi:hypothetical protein
MFGGLDPEGVHAKRILGAHHQRRASKFNVDFGESSKVLGLFTIQLTAFPEHRTTLLPFSSPPSSAIPTSSRDITNMARKAAPSSSSASTTPSKPATTTPTTTTATTTPFYTSSSKPSTSLSSRSSPQEIALHVWDEYLQTTPSRTFLLDAFMAFLVVVGAVQFLYAVLFGNYVSDTCPRKPKVYNLLHELARLGRRRRRNREYPLQSERGPY